MGIPCIASNVGGIPTFVQEGVTGSLYDDVDPFELAEKIIRNKGKLFRSHL